MPVPKIRAEQINSVKRATVDVTTSGSALITKVIAGTNITISSTGVDAGTGDVTVNAAAQGLTWALASGSPTGVAGNGYIFVNIGTLTLPSGNVGDVIGVAGRLSGGYSFTVALPSGAQFHYPGGQSASTTGTLTGMGHDWALFVCTQAGAKWAVIGASSGLYTNDSPIRNNIGLGWSTDQNGTNIAAQDMTVNLGNGTGNATVPRLLVMAPAQGTASGSTTQLRVTREALNCTKTGFTSGAATSLIDVSMPAGSMAGMCLEFTLESTDGTDYQAITDYVNFSAVNKAGAYTTQIVAGTKPTNTVSAGTLTITFTIVTGTNKVTIKATATSSLASPAIRLTYTINNYSQQDITIL